MQDIKYRLVNPGLRPRKTKLEMPGWAGKPAPRTDRSHEYAWHCAPVTKAGHKAFRFFTPTRTNCMSREKTACCILTAILGRRPTTTCNGRRSANSVATII